MLTRRHRLIGALATVGALTIAACGGDDGDSGGDAQQGTLRVWFMTGEFGENTRKALVEEFEKSHEGIKVDAQEQQWANVQGRTINALASRESPDVIEFGNTFTASFALGLTDLTDRADELGKADWFAGMAASATVNGRQVAVPYLAGARLVIYRTDMFEQAGITAPPTTLDQFTAAADRLQATFGSNPRFSAFAFPGRYWYGMLPFIWDAGGDIAVQDGDAWKGTLDSAEARKGLSTLKDLVAKYSRAPLDATEQDPLNVDKLGSGEAAMALDNAFNIGTILQNHKDITQDQLGVFALPGTNGPAPQLAGGSNIGIARSSRMQDAAFDFVKLWTSPKYMAMSAGEAGLVPNSSTVTVADASPTLEATTAAISNSRFVPVSAKWAAVEGAQTLNDMLQAILTGAKSVEEATTEASEAITATLN